MNRSAETGELAALDAARALAEHPDVTAAAVVVHDEDTDPLPVGYVVSATGAPLDTADLWKHLAAQPSGCDGPGAFVFIDRMPTTADGEPDRALLPRAARGDTDDSAGPRIVGGVAAEVADIWREAFQLAAVDLVDDIFDLGGHSLTITRIANQIRVQLGVDVPLAVFYDTPTVPAIVAAIEEIRGTEPIVTNWP